MAFYLTIEPNSRTEWTGGTLPASAPCTQSAPYGASNAGTFPIGEVKFYQPSKETIFKKDPTKGLRRNWSQIKESGEISFTPYSVSKTTINNYVVEQLFDLAKWKFHIHGCPTSQKTTHVGPWEGHLIYRRKSTVVDYDPLGIYVTHAASAGLASHEEEVVNAISTTQQAAFANATSTYDALTDLAELGETLKFMLGIVSKAAVSLSSFASTAGPTFKGARGMNAKQLLKSSDKKLQKLGSRWMAYRYAIMPLIYSLKDINDLLGKTDARYQTGRDKDRIITDITLDDYTLPFEGFGIFQTRRIVSDVRSLFKVRYDSGALQRLFSQTTFNPFITAWELIPLSFVIDWFVNVGDAIACATRIDSSTQSLGVTAIKTSRVDNLILYDFSVDRSRYSFGGWYDMPAFSVSYTHKREVSSSLQQVVVDSYKRIVYTKPEPKLEINVYLNWKRILDSLVLSYQPIKKLLRSL